jgi:hypothetical protein
MAHPPQHLRAPEPLGHLQAQLRTIGVQGQQLLRLFFQAPGEAKGTQFSGDFRCKK